ncbi:hypothetical protein GCM10027187_40030 [Streptosporangium sandarakinum]|uniref:Uncharacterized protein n=1 Tax=Streptosporangium sandarakinum TaxID=1260955 RepID=A0A852VEN1_9ACTN|nr:hypothetical protein [Streptosporangium sandarakinum]NYF44665.1 hypothetical protein [Streptosporangium sandarakinum]
MIYQAITDDERPGTGLVCNLCRSPVDAAPCPEHARYGSDADWLAATGTCGGCGRDGHRCDGGCGCRCAPLHPVAGRVAAIPEQAVLDLDLSSMIRTSHMESPSLASIPLGGTA